MAGFLAEVGAKLADRWAALLAVPGLLYLAAATAAAVLGQRRALDYGELSRDIEAWAAGPSLRAAGGAALIAAAVLAASLALGLVAAAGGRLVEIVWTASGEHPPGRWLTDRRRQRSARFKAVADSSIDPATVRAAIAEADRICLIEPGRPTWIGDRLRAGQVRVERTYGLDLSAAWPRLWLSVPDTVRAELAGAGDAFGASARLTAWAGFYLILGVWWWPALLIGAGAAVAGVERGRVAAGNLADLIEATVDLHGAELTRLLGQRTEGSLDQATGRRITTLMLKSRWDPESPLAQ
ncbi:hypothetical protein KDL01_20060 [Actinospica durhamensis]|uniref:Vegetative cell wall protein gp1 n=1 Tax=Actinospica durhamensis TaxID=1508375 RepID=A0A941ENC2_9ACTN|nr:hypothetical protein [Actinospica durhamensis]MBR7835580.1 hypothetical protein [Actinospica durhamensis]